MIPWELLDRAPVPGDGGELRLLRRGEEFSIRLDGYELMNSAVYGSEDALAEISCARLTGRPRPKVLVGGLGMGYTLAAALRRLGPQSRLTVAELVPAVVEWNRGALGPLAGHPLRDPRVVVRVGDVAGVLADRTAGWDAVLMDVDNGPEGLTRQANDALYTPDGLAAARMALRPGGLLSVWSASPDRAFFRRMQQAGFRVREYPVRARGARGGSHYTVWVGRRGNRP